MRNYLYNALGYYRVKFGSNTQTQYDLSDLGYRVMGYRIWVYYERERTTEREREKMPG